MINPDVHMLYDDVMLHWPWLAKHHLGSGHMMYLILIQNTQGHIMPVTTGAERMYDLPAQTVKERRASMSNDELPHHHTHACLDENRYCKNFPKPPVTINDGNTHNDHYHGDAEDICKGYHQGDKANHSLLRASSIITAAVLLSSLEILVYHLYFSKIIFWLISS